jgi:hypothetical protein
LEKAAKMLKKSFINFEQMFWKKLCFANIESKNLKKYKNFFYKKVV